MSTKYISLWPFTKRKPNFIERFPGTDTASFEIFFNIFSSGIETFVIPWDQRLYPYVVKICRLGLKPLYVTFISYLESSCKFFFFFLIGITAHVDLNLLHGSPPSHSIYRQLPLIPYSKSIQIRSNTIPPSRSRSSS